MKNKLINYIFILFLWLLVFSFYSCDINDFDINQAFNNEEPQTILANIPPDDPDGKYIYNPELTLSWYGYDKDGFIKGFKYRWCTLISDKDTLWTDWIFIPSIDNDGNKIYNSNKKNFVFESPNDKNFHIFEIAAIDNKGKTDSSPAKLRFWTKKGPETETELISFPSDETIVSENTNKYWKGLVFIFNDKNSKYAFKINNSEWSDYIYNDTIILSGKHFPNTGDYTIYFKSRNKYYMEDKSPLEFNIKIIKPIRTKELLLIDMTSDGISLPGNPTDEETDSFYKDILRDNNINFDIWDVNKEGCFPDRLLLSNYKIIFIYSDHNFNTSENKLFFDDIQKLNEFLFTGGNIIISCKSINNLFYNNEQAFLFFYELFQIENNFNTIEILKSTQLNKINIYPELEIEQSKIPFEWYGGLQNIQTFYPRAFNKSIYFLDSTNKINTTISLLNTKVYKAVLSTLPLYYFKYDGVKQLIKIIFENLK